MVSPTTFGFNPETAASNVYQHDSNDDISVIRRKALLEWQGVVDMLKREDVEVVAVTDTTHPVKPDALFPNNWITTHEDGTIIVYPLLAANRRHEKRTEVVEQVAARHPQAKIVDLSSYEERNMYLEGTGSMILDRKHKIAYACLSPRTFDGPLQKVGELLGYTVVAFQAHDKERPLYHTNLLMSVGEKWVAICMDAITDASEKKNLYGLFAKTGKTVILLDRTQIATYAGNIIELESKSGEKKILMSARAAASLTPKQKELFERFGKLCIADVSTIEEVGGGGIRCLVAELFL